MDEQKPSKIGTKEYFIDKISKITTQEQPRNVTGISERRPPAWRRFFVENWVYKVTALILTLMLFYIVNIDKAKDAALDINVLISHLPKNKIITNIDKIPRKLHLEIRGRWSDLAKALQKKMDPYHLDMSGYEFGDTQVRFSMSNIRKIIGVPGVTIQSITPSNFTVKVAPREEKMVIVEPRPVGKLPKGYKLGNKGIVVSPPKIKIWGIRSTIEKIKHLDTEPIDLSKINKSTVLDVAIRQYKDISVSMNKKIVKVNIYVTAIIGKRRFTNVVINIKNCPNGYACIVKPKKVRVGLKGPEPDLLALDAHKFAGGVSIDASGLDVSQSVYRVSPNCERPASISCRLHPRSVKLRFVKKHTEVSVDTNGPKGQPKLHKKSVKKNNHKNSKHNVK